MKNRSVTIWVVVAVLLPTSLSRAALMGYVASQTSNSVVYLTNFDTGEQIPLGPSGIWEITGIETSPINGCIVVVDNNRFDLWNIDATSGLGSRISEQGYESNGYDVNLSFAIDGTLYGLSRDFAGIIPPKLMTKNLNTGENTLISLVSTYTQTTAFAIDNSGKGIGWDSGAKWLFEIDLTDGATKSIGQLQGSFSAFDYGPDGILYGWSGNSLYRINIESCSATYLRNFSQSGSSFAIIPEPATLVLLGLGVPILSGLRRNR